MYPNGPNVLNRAIFRSTDPRAKRHERRYTFCPVSDGFLHIGTGTALFNWLYARHTTGKCLLDRDTDRKQCRGSRRDPDGLDWLGLSPDEDPLTSFPDATSI